MASNEIREALNRHWSAADANDFAGEHAIYREDAVLADGIPGAVVCDTVMVFPERRAEVGRGLLEAIG